MSDERTYSVLFLETVQVLFFWGKVHRPRAPPHIGYDATAERAVSNGP